MVMPPSSPYYSDAAFNAMMPMAAVYTMVANLAVFVLQPLNLFPHPEPLPLQTSFDMKVAIVTGFNTGIGLETARTLVDSGWNVILACRSRDKALKAVSQIRGMNQALVTLDLSSFSSIKEFAKTIRGRYSKVHVLINNAGRNTSGPSENGLDLCFSTIFSDTLCWYTSCSMCWRVVGLSMFCQ